MLDFSECVYDVIVTEQAGDLEDVHLVNELELAQP
jgi:hypothetical protein